MNDKAYDLKDIKHMIDLTAIREGKASMMMQYNQMLDSREEGQDPYWAVTLYPVEDIPNKHLVIRGKSREEVHEMVRTSSLMWSYSGINIEPLEDTVYIFKE